MEYWSSENARTFEPQYSITPPLHYSNLLALQYSNTPLLLLHLQQLPYILMNFLLVMLIGGGVGHNHV
jgi:hypothetical protein